MFKEFILFFNILKVISESQSENSIPTPGIYSDDIKDSNQFQIVYPEKITKDGSFVSHYLPHFYDIENYENRLRRAPGPDKSSKRDEIHFVVPINGEKQHLELWPNWNFIAPGLVVERRDARDVDNVNKAKISQISSKQCHYSGEIVGKPNSIVALSTCYGLAGYIKEPSGDEFFIEPVKDSRPDPGKEHPHIIYKRTSSSNKEKPDGPNCLTKGRATDALVERLQWESLYGDQVRKDHSGRNINDLVRDSPLNEKSSVPDVSSRENVKRVKNKVSNNWPDSLKLTNKYIKADGKMLSINIPQNFQSPNQNLGSVYSRWPGAQSGKNKFPIRNRPKPNNVGEEISKINVPANYDTMTNIINEKDLMNYKYQNNNGNEQDVDEVYTPRRIKRDLSEVYNQNEMDDGKINLQMDSNSNLLESSNNPEGGIENKVGESEDRKKGTQPETAQNFDCKKTYDDSQLKITKQKKRNIDKVNDNLYTSLRETIQENFNDGKLVKTNGIDQKILKKRNYAKELQQPLTEQEVSDDESKEESRALAEKFKQHEQTQGNKDASLAKSSDISNSHGKEKTNTVVNNYNNLKRDIHLDTSEKSWEKNQPGKLEKSDKSGEKSEKMLKSDDDSHSKDSALHNNDVKNDKTPSFTRVDRNNLNTDEQIMASVLENVIKDIDKNKVKKEIGVSDEIGLIMGSSGIINNQLKGQLNDVNTNSHNLKGVVQEHNQNFLKSDQIYKTDKESLEQNQGVNSKIVMLNSDSAGGGGRVKTSDKNAVKETESQNKEDNILNEGDEIIIRIKSPEGMISSVSKQDSVLNSKGDNSNGDFSLVPKTSQIDSLENKGPVSLQNTGNQNLNKPGLSNIQNEYLKQIPQKSPEYVPWKRDADHIENCVNVKSNSLGTEEKPKTKRDDTIHLVFENEPAVSAAEGFQKENLFCQGRNCLEIKAVVLNDTNAALGTTNNGNTNNISTNSTENAKVIKRQIDPDDLFEDECQSKTTEGPLMCIGFDKMFNLELMITVDYKVIKMHEGDDIENFILTIMNMVSTNFYDKSIGINLNVFLVRLILLTTCIKELDSEIFNPEELLENFCTWQLLINPGRDDHPHHHDLAIFVTRMDKCEGQVMGLTYMTSICRPDKSCLVCVDEGLLLANTITHQIGHALGADHDESEGYGCSSTTVQGTNYHMAPTIRETSSSWSPCSRDSIIQFVRTQGSWCLSDLPQQRDFNYPLILPGQIYSAAQQCKLNFHMTAIPCSVGAFCEKLYCQVTEKLCATKGDPPADGTFCASDMWCFHKQCVHIGRRPGAINGEWGPWTEWTLCTRSCGGGISSSYRICNNPKPSNGGRYCIGDRIRHRMCAVTPCLGFSEGFRDLQCKKTEDRPFRGKLHNWLQYQSFFINIECALVCQNRRGEVVMRSPLAADGTPCKAGTKNVCIQGLCRNVGCDWVIDSNAREDSCGVCRGNGTECTIVQGIFDEPVTKKGLVEFLRAPKNSGMIFVRELSPSANYLVVSGSINRVFYLNGLGQEDAMPGDVAFGQAHGVYEVRSGMERIFIKGPTAEELVFYIQFREPNKGVHYQYAIPEVDTTYIPRYLWEYVDWDPCTDPCSGGSQRARAKCVEDRGGVVDDMYCTESSRPIDVIRPCNDFPCQAKWWVSVWSDCICTGSTSLMFRSVLCMRAIDEGGSRAEIVKESECSSYKKPACQRPCDASDEDDCSDKVSKRSLSRDDIGKSLNPRAAYSQFTPADAIESEDGSAQHLVSGDSLPTENNNNQEEAAKYKKRTVKVQPSNNSNQKSNPSKEKLSDSKEGIDKSDKKKVNSKGTVNLKTDKKEESKSQPDTGEALSSTDLKNKAAKLNSKSSSPINDISSVKNDKPPEDDGSNAQCETSTEAMCITEATSECTTMSTCRVTCPLHPLRKTTCCKTPQTKFQLKTSPPELTTPRPINVVVDELNMNNFQLTVVPLDLIGKKRIPQSDPEFVHLGIVGQFGVADESNATILQGQQALDFLDAARRNSSEEPVILHEDMHN